jgi:hypothetical protein
MPFGRPSYLLIWRRILSFLLQKDQCFFLQMSLLRPLFCSRHANVLLNRTPFTASHLPSSSFCTEFSISIRMVLYRRGRLANRSHRIPVVVFDRVFCECTRRPQPSHHFLRLSGRRF